MNRRLTYLARSKPYERTEKFRQFAGFRSETALRGRSKLYLFWKLKTAFPFATRKSSSVAERSTLQHFAKMKTIRKSDLITGIALISSIVFAATCSAQLVVQPLPLDAPVANGNVIRQLMPSTATAKHLGNSPIDRNNLSAEVLNCEVCRQRLGLPPLGIATNEAGVLRMLGSPGLISPRTAEQMASQGMVVEEFKPPQPQQDAIRLGDLPPEVRQQFMRSLDLPLGATIMSAKIKDQSSADQTKTESVEPSNVPSIGQNNSTSESSRPSDGTPPSLGAPGIALKPFSTAETEVTPMAETAPALIVVDPVPNATQPTESVVASQIAISQLQSDVREQAAAQIQMQLEKEQAATEKILSLNVERENLAKERTQLRDQLDQVQVEWKKRMEQADAANREALTLLEKRTAEVSALQLQLKSQQEAFAKSQQDKPSKDNSDSKKKAPIKGKEKAKKPEKKTIDT